MLLLRLEYYLNLLLALSVFSPAQAGAEMLRAAFFLHAYYLYR
jgi:hypothetical protein